MEAGVRSAVRERAGNRCEYCSLPQEGYDLTFHVEHVIATQHAPDDSIANLALACDRCNLHKGTNLSSIDPDTGDHVSLFHPRKHEWVQHFEFVGAEIIGLTAIGRASARLLQMNAERRLLLRKQLIESGHFFEA